MSDHLNYRQIDLPLFVDRSRAQPLSGQIAGQVRAAVRAGRLASGERLPSGRALAAALGVSRTVVMEAYLQLYAEGWLDGRQGSGTYVADVAASPVAQPSPAERCPAAPALERPATAADTPMVHDLRPGMPWTAGVDGAAWRRAWRQAAAVPLVPGHWPDKQGSPAVRQALADYLRRARGVVCRPHQIVVTRGATHGLSLLAGAFLEPGDRVGVEEPGYAKARAVLVARGAEVVPCPVDEDGLVVEALPEDLRLVYTTPAHQYPLGGRLPIRRRQALLGWAARCGALVAEDDYDGEFRYDVAPLPTLHGLDPGVVVYLGTTSKILTPDLGVGWLVASEAVARRVAGYRGELGDPPPAVPQEAVRLLVERGELERHVRRMRGEYARRRAAVVAAFRDLPAPLRLLGDTAGLHVVLALPATVTASVTRAAHSRGIGVGDLAAYYAGPADRHGLVIGYGGLPLAELRRACTALRALLPVGP
ncbi:MAG: PLP-dependent aminotransferase family protein [Carbonactinosporaceae bacterium]